MEVSDVSCLFINFGQDSHAEQVQYGHISFALSLVPVFTIRQECSVVKPADMEGALVQGSTSTAGAILTSRKDMPGVFLIVFFRCMNT